ncbi:MAG: cation-translocating P-type ATPase [Atopobiaceae bacterium]|nr:cation-translocating P-type ATPase [Atopobiaceae bacterium]
MTASELLTAEDQVMGQNVSDATHGHAAHHDGAGHEHHGHEHHEHCCDHEHDHCDHEHGHEHHEHCCDHDHCHDHCGCDHDHDHDHCCCDHDHHAADEHQLHEKPSFSYHVLGVDCPNCALGTQNAVRALSSVEDARLVYATATLEVVAEKNVLIDDCKREVLACVRSCGQDLELTDDERERLEAERPWIVENREALLMSASGVSIVAGLMTEFLFADPNRAISFYVIAALAGLVFVAPMAWASLRRRTADMNVLMSIAVIGGLIMGFMGDTDVFRDAAIVIFLDQIGEWLEGWSMRKTSGSIKELMDLTPDVAHVIDEYGHTSDVDVKLVEEGQRIRILPGERVPLDGVILHGSSSFNEAPVTGESIPQDKGEGSDVYAGSLNTSTAVDIEVTADEDCTTLARIISMVQGAQAEKAPYESFVDRFAASYTPIVICGALIVGIAVPLVVSLVTGFRGEVWHDWVYRALSLLVVACPCALVISTPVSFVSALTRAAKSGVLVKGGAYFDIATKVKTIAFDKTGTLTTGRPKVTDVVCFNGATEQDVLKIAYTLEASSTHPLGRAVAERAEELGIKAVACDDVEEVASNGLLAHSRGVEYLVGKIAFAQEHAQVGRRVAEEVERLGATGATALVVCGGGRVAGVIGVADAIRESTPMAMDALERAGITETVMLTGDNPHAAASVAGAAGVRSFAAELLPDQKVSHIRQLQNGGKVAMVGDGINDAPALAAADLGITMGAAASDTALEVADVALLSDDLNQLPAFFELSFKTMNVVRENIAFAIGVKILVFVLVIMGIAGMGAAVFADTGVALIVILNGMRLMAPSRIRW